ncbi:ABC transporter permease [Paenarthrobacter sp. YIM B13468]|uniref:ABC transporter permease n=1 Tax=Paenarthrobacter sp. YIM B13468 TaxID=3366295 RepID=UPI003671BCA5
MLWTKEFEAPQRRAVTEAGPSRSASPSSSAGRHVGSWFVRFGPTLVLIVLGLLFWQFVLTRVNFLGIPSRYLGSPKGIIDALVTLVQSGYTGTPLWQHFLASISRTLFGVGLAALVGVPLGLGIGLNRFLDRLLSPIIGFLRPIPALAWIPIVVIWLGIGEQSKVFVIFMTAVLFVSTGAALGVRAVPQDFYLVARNYGLSRVQFLREVVLPPALPQILAGLRTALTVGWAVVVAAELIGASQGLGYMIRNSSQVFDVNTGYVGILLIGVVGVAFEYGFRYFENRLLHWQVSR